MPGKGLGAEAPGVKNTSRSRHGENYLVGVFPEDIVPGNGLVMWVAKQEF
jgi:hypothetical protein